MNEEMIKAEYKNYMAGISFNKTAIVDGVTKKISTKEQRRCSSFARMSVAAALAVVIMGLSVFFQFGITNDMCIYAYASDGTGYRIGEIPVNIGDIAMDMAYTDDWSDYSRETHIFDVRIEDEDVESVKYTILNKGKESEDKPDADKEDVWFLQQVKRSSEEVNDPEFFKKNTKAYLVTGAYEPWHEGEPKPVYDVALYEGKSIETDTGTEGNKYGFEMVVRNNNGEWKAPTIRILAEAKFKDGKTKQNVIKLEPVLEEPFNADEDDMPTYQFNMSVEKVNILTYFNNLFED